MSEPRVKAGIWVSMALRMGNAGGRFGEGDLAWLRATGAAPVDQETADTYIARQVKYDPDLWVIEFEAPDLLPPFEAKLV
jgi:hypothetical protein